MERRKLQPDPQKWEKLKTTAEHSGGLVGALAKHITKGPFDGNTYNDVDRALFALYSKPLTQLTADEFLSKDLKKAVEQLAGKEIAGKLPALLSLRMEGPFSSSPWRRSYRSKYFPLYIETVIDFLCDLVRQSCYEETVLQRLSCTESPYGGFPYLLALEIRTGNEEIVTALHEAMAGENTQVLLTREMIESVIISGHSELLDDLIKLLLTAKLQEGLRQQILEAADIGSGQVLCRILKTCIDHDLFRFSGTIRAFDTWTGMGCDNGKIAQIRSYAQIAYDCLTDPVLQQEYMQSSNNIQTYFALWARGCQEFKGLYTTIRELLDDEDHYRRVLGWMFVSRSDNRQFQMELAARHLQERDEELLAWVVDNLAQSWAFIAPYWHKELPKAGKCVQDSDFPADKKERRALFDQLKALGEFIGSKKRTFSGNPFDFISVTLNSEKVYGCMICLVGYDMDKMMVNELLDLSTFMTTDQRRSLIWFFMRPETQAEHRCRLLGFLNDRSITVRELALKRLGNCKLNIEELEALADCLRSKSSDLRAGVMSVLKKQPIAQLRSLVTDMLLSPDENQMQAAITLILELQDHYPDLMSTNHTRLEALHGKKLSSQTKILLEQLLPVEEIIAYSPENGYGLYDPNIIKTYLASLDPPVKKANILSAVFGDSDIYSVKEIKALIPTMKELDLLLGRMDEVFVRHAETEFEIELYDGSRQMILFGDMEDAQLYLPTSSGCQCLSDSGATLEMLPFWEEFREVLGDYAQDVRKMLGLYYLTCRTSESSQQFSIKEYQPWYWTILALGLSPVVFSKFFTKYARIWQMLQIIEKLPTYFDEHDVFAEAIRFYRSMVALLGEDKLPKPYVNEEEYPSERYYRRFVRPLGINTRMLSAWRYLIHKLKLNDADFEEWFRLEYRLEQNITSNVEQGLYTESFSGLIKKVSSHRMCCWHFCWMTILVCRIRSSF